MTRHACLARLYAFMAALFALILVVGMPAVAQTPKDAPSLIEAGRLELQQIEARLQRETLSDAQLADLRTRLDPIVMGIDEIVSREQQRLDEIRARIEKLGPAPDAAKGQSESAEIAKDRAEQQKQFQQADEAFRLAQAFAVRLVQIREMIAERRRQNFAREILRQNSSILSPRLWFDVIRAFPTDLRAMNFLVAHGVETIIRNLDWSKFAILLAFAIAAGFVVLHARRWARSHEFGLRQTEEGTFEASQLTKALIGLRVFVLDGLLPAILLLVFHALISGFGLLSPRTEPIMDSLTSGLATVFAASALAQGVLSPVRHETRLFAMSDRMAREMWRLVRLVTIIAVGGDAIGQVLAATSAGLPITMLVKGLAAGLAAIAMMRGARRAFRAEPEDHVQSFGVTAIRLAIWSAAVIILIAIGLGFISLGYFLVEQVLWLTFLGLMALLAFILIEEGFGGGLSARGVFGRRVREATGLAASSIDQVSVLGSGLARLAVFVVVGMLALAPWGVDSTDYLDKMKAAFFGFQVGGVTVSIATIVTALVLFAAGFFATRTIQNWLDTRYLPQTGLDLGLRNSIRTIFGYIGVIIAAMVAMSQLGLGVEKLTLVAGALSVGIGFGLKSIVENFVSGLILLWERPIRVGDWVVIGQEQGTVTRINVRSTEIQTFDRASLIIPNAEFISGRVKNWMHADRMGRIIIPVSVEYSAEPEAVHQLLLDAALAHREVLSEPAPSVIFKNFGESGLDFELRCFVDVDSMGSTRSELLFDIFRRLREAKVAIPYPTRRVEITGLPAGEAGVEALAAIGRKID